MFIVILARSRQVDADLSANVKWVHSCEELVRSQSENLLNHVFFVLNISTVLAEF